MLLKSPALPDVAPGGRSGDGGAGRFPQCSPVCGPSTCSVEPRRAPSPAGAAMPVDPAVSHVSLLVNKLWFHDISNIVEGIPPSSPRKQSQTSHLNNKDVPVGMRATGPPMCLRCHLCSGDRKLGFFQNGHGTPLSSQLNLFTGFFVISLGPGKSKTPSFTSHCSLPPNTEIALFSLLRSALRET